MNRNINIYDDFDHGINPTWVQITTGGGKIRIHNSVLRMSFNYANKESYTDVQLDDYTLQLGYGLPT